MKPGACYGITDDYSYNIVENPVHIRELNATMLHCLGMDHTASPSASKASTKNPLASNPPRW